MTYNDELYHYGVLGMRWGKRKKSIAAEKPKGDRGNWGRDPKSEREQRSIDDNGINSNRSYGTKPKVRADFKNLKKQTVSKIKNSKSESKGKVIAGNILSGAAGAAVATAASYAFVVRVGRNVFGE